MVEEHSERHRRAIPVLSVTIFLGFAGQSMILPIISLHAVSLGGSVIDVGLIFLFNTIFAAVLAIPLGSLSDRVGRKNMIVLGLLIASLAAILLAQANSVIFIMAVYAISGLGMAAYGVAATAAIGDYASKDRFVSGYGWSQVARSMGYTIGPATGGTLAGLIGFQSTFLVAGSIQLGTILVASTLLPRRSRITTAVSTRDKVSVKQILRNRAILVTLLTAFLVHTAMGTMNSFFPLFLDSIGLTPFIIGAFFALLALTYAMSRFLVAGYSDRTGHKALPLALSIGGVVLAVAFLASFENILLIVLIVGVLGLCFGVSNLLQGTVVAEQADQRIRGFALGLFLSVIVAGAGAGPAVLSPVADSYGFEVAFRVNALLILTGLVTVLIAWRKANLK